ncbi:MAG TPA: glycosyl hydrolase family 8 [Polyangiaceae bacterium]|nr:glycosyl hydrolase family 8 [Polyangiaceae bacterium]
MCDSDVKWARGWARYLTSAWPLVVLSSIACAADAPTAPPLPGPVGNTRGGAGPGGAGSGGSGQAGAGPLAADAGPLDVEPTDIELDLFAALLGKSSAEVDEKVTTAVNRFFGIGTGESAVPVVATGYRCYYELPQDPSLAFIWAADSNDVRSEGMSYGMMIAVQVDLHEQFDRLWNFARTYMQYPAGSEITAWRHYFKWQGSVDTTDPASWVVTYGATTVPAPDGDEYFAAALYLAHRRWGSDGAINYLEEANNIASAMLHNQPMVDVARFPIIHDTANMVTFVPFGASNEFSDPSYHLPAFYDLFAQDGPAEDREAWTSLAETSRDYLVLSAHPATGLHPDYATFEGVGVSNNQQHDQFRYDAWRVVMNMAVDYAWFSRDRRMRQQIEKYHEFFAPQLTDDNVTNQLFALDGTTPSGGGSTALTATLAAGSLASQRDDRARFVNSVWNVAQQQGQYRYYQESVYLLGLLNVAGKFNHSW